MKICMLLLSDFEVFTQDSRVLREASALIDAGNSVGVVLYGRKQEQLRYKDIEVRVVRIDSMQCLKEESNTWCRGLRLLKKLHTKAVKYFRFYPECHTKMMEEALTYDADVYHCHDYETLEIGIHLKRTANKAVIYDSHELWVGRRDNTGIKGFLKKHMLYPSEKRLIKSADAVITVNGSLAGKLESMYAIPHVHVIRNIPESIAQLGTFRDTLRNSLGIRQDRKIVLYQGALVTGRGLFNLIKAWKYVKPEIVLVIMGSGPLENLINRKISNYAYMDRVFLKQAVKPEEVLIYTTGADLGISPIQNICPSYYYSLPNKVFEYILAGTPFLASDFPEMNRLASEIGIGMSINPESPRDMAEKINLILDKCNSELRESMIKNCLLIRENKYNWKLEKNKLLELYNSLPLEQIADRRL